MKRPRALTMAREETRFPSLILVATRIGYGSPREGTAEVHGAPLGWPWVRANDPARTHDTKTTEPLPQTEAILSSGGVHFPASNSGSTGVSAMWFM